LKGEQLRPYEGLFLVEEGKATEAPQEVNDHIHGLLDRHGAKVEKFEKWISGRLAYEVDGKKRGTYFIVNFEAEPAQVDALRKDCGLSPIVLRTMILRKENVGQTLQDAEDAIRAARRAQGLPENPETPERPEGEADAVGPADLDEEVT